MDNITTTEKEGKGHVRKEIPRTAVTCPACAYVFVTEKEFPNCPNRQCGKTFPAASQKMRLG